MNIYWEPDQSDRDQALSLVRSVLKIVGAALTAHGATDAASIINSEDAVGLAMTLIGLLLSYRAHKSIQPTIIKINENSIS